MQVLLASSTNKADSITSWHLYQRFSLKLISVSQPSPPPLAFVSVLLGGCFPKVELLGYRLCNIPIATLVSITNNLLLLGQSFNAKVSFLS